MLNICFPYFQIYKLQTQLHNKNTLKTKDSKKNISNKKDNNVH